MTDRRLFVTANLFLLVLTPRVCLAQGYQRNVSQNWNFSTGSDLQGWSPIVPLPQFAIQNGVLQLIAINANTIIFSPAITVATAPMQLVEIVMKSNTSGPAKVFWAPSPSVSNPQTGFTGFQGGDENDYTMVGDGAFHHYYLPIATTSATTIYRLRLDLPANATIAIQSVDIANLIAPAASSMSPVWQFTVDGNSLGWIPYQGVVDMAAAGGSLQLSTYANTTLLAPSAQITNQLEWFSIMGTVTQTALQTPWIQFNYASSSNNGNPGAAYVPLIADSTSHVYNTNVGGDAGWYATVSQLSITVSENTTVNISSIELASAPQGPPDLQLDACGPVTPLIRAGSPFQISCRVTDRGAQPIQGISASLTLPSDGSVSVTSSPSILASLLSGYPQTLTWSLVASQPETIVFSIAATSANGGSAQSATSMLVNPAVSVAPAAYVPPPVPVYSDYDIGIFYFPGWSLDSHWDPIRNFPERTPVLGNYAEGDPRVLDWQIKWAVEHGISFFAVDWMWYEPGQAASPGELPNNFLQAYSTAAYRDYIHYCLAYANNTAAVTVSTVPEFQTITEAWIANYFTQPTYYRINNMPVVFILTPQQLDASLKGATAGALASARQMAKAAGYNGIYFIASSTGNPGYQAQLATDGYDAITQYTYGAIASAIDPDEASYAAAIPSYEDFWSMDTAASTVPYYLPATQNWNPRPWKPWQFGGGDQFVENGATPALYANLLQAAKARIDSGKNPPILMADAWNEFGEGHWSEPTAGLGFTYLDAIRNVFASTSPHSDVGPTDVGLPLLETQPATSLFTFNTFADLSPWLVSPGPPFYDYSVNISNSQVTNSQWTFTSNGGAILTRMGFNLSAANYSSIAIHMSASANSSVTLYWAAVDEPGISAVRNASFNVSAGSAQTYTLTLNGKSGWRGIIDLIDLNISCPPNTTFTIDSIEFLPVSASPSLVASRTQLEFASAVGSVSSLSQVLSVDTPNGPTSTWTATANAPWVNLSGASGTGLGNISVAVNPAGLAVGLYSAKISVAAAGVTNSSLIVPVSLWVTPAATAAPLPSIISIVNGADFKVEPLSVGTWFSILGQNLGQAESAATPGALIVGGASVSVCGASAVVSYNSGPLTAAGTTSWQINALVPDGVSAQSQCPVIVTVGQNTAQSVNVAIAPGILELFQFTSSVGTLPIITHADYSLVGPSSAGLVPAKPNEPVIAWATGDCSTPTITVGGVRAAVAFSGRVEPGLCQVNFVVPAGFSGSNPLALSSSPNTYPLWIAP